MRRFRSSRPPSLCSFADQRERSLTYSRNRDVRKHDRPVVRACPFKALDCNEVVVVGVVEVKLSLKRVVSDQDQVRLIGKTQYASASVIVSLNADPSYPCRRLRLNPHIIYEPAHCVVETCRLFFFCHKYPLVHFPVFLYVLLIIAHAFFPTIIHIGCLDCYNNHMLNTKNFFMKVAIILIVAVVVSGSVFASDADGTGSLLKVGMAQGGLVGMFADAAGVDAPVALDISQEFADESVEVYLAGADIVEYGASNAELSDEELEALEGSVELLKSAKANFGPIALEMLSLSEEDAVVQAVGNAYAKAFEAIGSGNVSRADILAVAGLVGVFSEFDDISFNTVDGEPISMFDYLFSGDNVPEINEDEAAEVVLYNVINTMIYFDIVFDVYDLGFSFSDLFANFAY